mmetsp:Transcript_13282/g.40782  ORF Transcript_13282/g.40782 Transcript_13282/m.40782 type:complete len:239 (-) Transcript_13282:319-1035(-)
MTVGLEKRQLGRTVASPRELHMHAMLCTTSEDPQRIEQVLCAQSENRLNPRRDKNFRSWRASDPQRVLHTYTSSLIDRMLMETMSITCSRGTPKYRCPSNLLADAAASSSPLQAMTLPLSSSHSLVFSSRTFASSCAFKSELDIRLVALFSFIGVPDVVKVPAVFLFRSASSRLRCLISFHRLPLPMLSLTRIRSSTMSFLLTARQISEMSSYFVSGLTAVCSKNMSLHQYTSGGTWE